MIWSARRCCVWCRHPIRMRGERRYTKRSNRRCKRGSIGWDKLIREIVRLILINMCVNYRNFLFCFTVVKWVNLVFFINNIRITKYRGLSYICSSSRMSSNSLSGVGCSSILSVKLLTIGSGINVYGRT